MPHVIRPVHIFAAAIMLVTLACGKKEQAVVVPSVVLDTTSYVEPAAVGTFPSRKEVIEGWIAAGDTVKIRQHGWDIWAALTAPTPKGLPVWETFYSGHEIFELDSTDKADSPGLRHVRDYEVPAQHVHVRRAAIMSHGIPVDVDERRTSFNRFSQATAQYITQHRLNFTETLDSINNAFNAANTPIAQRQVFVTQDSVDYRSFVLKVVFQFISGDSVSAVPTWRSYGAGRSSNDTLPVADTWMQGMAVDPTGKLPLGMSIVMPVNGGTPQALKVVHLKSFYWIKLTQADVDHFSTFVRPQGDDLGAANHADSASLMQMVKPGNIALLMAMHVTGKEIPNWTWQTFYWSPGRDSLNYDRPATITAPWNNYSMNTAYMMVNPDGQPRVAFNPYLETNLNGHFPAATSPKWFGVQTNCMTCHRLASRGLIDTTLTFAPYGPAQNIDPGNPSLFTGITKLDFLWSVAFRARPAGQVPVKVRHRQP